MTNPAAPQNPDCIKALLCNDVLIDAQNLAEGIAWLLSCSDWHLWYAVPKQEIIAIAGLVAEYVLGAEDRDIFYTAEGCSNQNSLSNFISEQELELRCRAAQPDAPELAKFAAALIYFRYCYDHNEFWELRHLAELAPPGANDITASVTFMQQLCPTLFALEQRYNEAMESELVQFKATQAEKFQQG